MAILAKVQAFRDAFAAAHNASMGRNTTVAVVKPVDKTATATGVGSKTQCDPKAPSAALCDAAKGLKFLPNSKGTCECRCPNGQTLQKVGTKAAERCIANPPLGMPTASRAPVSI